MTVTVHPTKQIVEINMGIKARVWEGETASGIKVQMLVPRISALATADLSEFEKELQEQPAPEAEMQVFPLRMII